MWIRNRRMPYLREYFNEINPIERAKVKFVISDMYDARLLPAIILKNAVHIVDLFHVIRLLTTAINQLRGTYMNACTPSRKENRSEYNFAKQHTGNFFLCR